ncbi:MAG: toast rack family protein [Chloroflexota bacterium]
MYRKISSVLFILMLGVSACGVSFELPDITPGPTETFQIEAMQPKDSANPTRLMLTFGAGELNITRGSEILVSGMATYNVADFKPEITSSDNTVYVKQGSYTLNKVPNFSKVLNTWDLKLGSMPMDLEITAGAYHADLELGDLSLTNLTVKDGASDVRLIFSEPNRVEMNLMHYETGASQVTLKGLANANFSILKFSGGAGNYSLDFSGNLQRDASVSINAGLGNLTIIIPDGMRVQLTIDGNLANINVGSNWNRQGKTYSQSGEGPLLTIAVDVGATNLTVTDN